MRAPTTPAARGARKQQKPLREVHYLFLGLPDARFYFGCKGHLHVFRRVGYRSGAFAEDAVMFRIGGAS